MLETMGSVNQVLFKKSMNSFGEIGFSAIIFINNTHVTFDKVLYWSKFVSELACL